MNKRLFLVTALVLLVLASGFAESTTWANPNDILAGFNPVPRSMLSAVSNGIYYDEIDTIILSPGELSNYSGYSIFTAYGNYEYDYQGATTYVNAFANPFTTTVLTPGTNAGNYMLGMTGEFFGLRSGLITSVLFDVNDHMAIASATTTTQSDYTQEDSNTLDADADGTADYTWTATENYTDSLSTTAVRMGAGVDFEILGASLYGIFSGQSRNLGGNYSYTQSLSADADYTDPFDVLTARTVTYGDGEAGAAGAASYDSYANWLLGVRGHLPLELFDISMPVKADVVFGSQRQAVLGVYNPMMTQSYTASTLSGITDPLKVNTITATDGQAMSMAGWDPQLTAGVLGAAATYNQAAFRALADAAGPSGTYAIDDENFKNVNFITGFDGLIDPEIVIADVFSIRTRGQLGYMFGVTSQDNAGSKSVNYSEAVEASDTNSIYSYSSTISSPVTVFSNTIDVELGGILDLHNADKTLGVSCGFFYHPTFDLSSTKNENSITTTSYSWIDESAAPDPEATLSTDIPEPGVVQGVRTDTVTTVWDNEGGTSNNRATNAFYIPATTSVTFADGALQLVGGYLLQHMTVSTKTVTPASIATTVTSLTDSDSTVIDTVNDSVETSSTVTTETTKMDAPWSGQMSFMLRWLPIDNMTVDFYGATIMDALDFEIFGNNTTTANPGTYDGFNIWNIINNLGICVTISAE
ncbi:MAG TPA: hypothetical protein DCO79_05155 [Spirochaeta sp.]|nr:hypothetical protein [Spirochaeta sp.]